MRNDTMKKKQDIQWDTRLNAYITQAMKQFVARKSREVGEKESGYIRKLIIAEMSKENATL